MPPRTFEELLNLVGPDNIAVDMHVHTTFSPFSHSNVIQNRSISYQFYQLIVLNRQNDYVYNLVSDWRTRFDFAGSQ